MIGAGHDGLASGFSDELAMGWNPPGWGSTFGAYSQPPHKRGVATPTIGDWRGKIPDRSRRYWVLEMAMCESHKLEAAD
jgi:hypothetical protein